MGIKQRVAVAVLALAAPLVMTQEGLRLTTYKDPVGIPTDCFGHTGVDVKLGASVTLDQCKGILADDLQKASDGIDGCIKVPLKDNERAALMSFTYNVGAGKFCGSTLARRINLGQLPAACAELDKWVFAGSEKLPGLVKRRAAERAMCEGKKT